MNEILTGLQTPLKSTTCYLPWGRNQSLIQWMTWSILTERTCLDGGGLKSY